MSKPELIDEVRKAPDEVLSFVEATEQVCYSLCIAPLTYSEGT